MLHVFIGMHMKMLSDSFLYGTMPIVLTVGGVKRMMSGGGWQYLRLNSFAAPTEAIFTEFAL